MSKLTEHVQKSDLGKKVEFYQLDLTVFGDQIIYWVAGDEGDSNILFQGFTYKPFPMRAEGFDMKSDGPLPKPTLTVSNASAIFTPLVNSYNGLRGATFRRLRTFERFLDTGIDPDATAVLPIDEYFITKKTKHTKTLIAWEMSSVLDVGEMQLPARQIIREYCDQSYRVWNGSRFDYSKATCPYTDEAALFNDKDQPVGDPANDRCGKRLGSCRLRFGQSNPLPFRGFPGVSRIRVR